MSEDWFDRSYRSQERPARRTRRPNPRRSASRHPPLGRTSRRGGYPDRRGWVGVRGTARERRARCSSRERTRRRRPTPAPARPAFLGDRHGATRGRGAGGPCAGTAGRRPVRRAFRPRGPIRGPRSSRPSRPVSCGRPPACGHLLGRRALLPLATVGALLRRHTGSPGRSCPGRRLHALPVRTGAVGARLTETVLPDRAGKHMQLGHSLFLACSWDTHSSGRGGCPVRRVVWRGGGCPMWRPVHEVERDILGATLVVARVGIAHEIETGRDKPVPYRARASRPAAMRCAFASCHHQASGKPVRNGGSSSGRPNLSQ